MTNKKKQKKNPVLPEQATTAPQPVKLLGWVTLSAISFICGCLVMVIELTSSRLLAPFYGNTIYCWTGVIGTILFALSFGYFFGGLLADKYREDRLLAILLGLSCLTVALIPPLAKWFSDFLARQSVLWGPIVSTLVIFALPALFLSTIPPICVKGISQDLKVVGLASGLVSSISAWGSIVGTFISGFYLIPTFDLSVIYYLAAAILLGLLVLLLIARPGVWRSYPTELFFIFLIVSMVMTTMYSAFANQDIFPNSPNSGEVYKKLTPYHLIRVYDRGDHYRLKLDSTDEGALAKSDYQLVFEYTKYWELIKCFRSASDLKRVAFVGGGAFAMPTVFHRTFPQSHVDAIEIDPELVSVGKRYFKLQEGPDFQVHISDGRRWFRDQRAAFDFIFLDVFHGPANIPPHMVTREYFGELHQALGQQGVLALNTIAACKGSNNLFYRTMVKTLLAHFDPIFVLAAHQVPDNTPTNLILFCLKNIAIPDNNVLRQAQKQNLGHLSQNLVEILTKDDIVQYKDVREFSDEYSPVEYMVFSAE